MIEIIGILMCLGLYFWKITTFPNEERWLAANYKFQTIWGKYMIFEMIRRVLGIKLELEFTPSLTPGPKILFMRHVSFADTLIPQYLSKILCPLLSYSFFIVLLLLFSFPFLLPY